ncbi:hypothetical protein ACOME3_000391 [Neoechinorhynchus agilis]
MIEDENDSNDRDVNTFCELQDLTDVQREIIKQSIKMQVLPYLQSAAQKEHPSNQAARQKFLHDLEKQYVDDYMENELPNQQDHQTLQAEQISRMCERELMSEFKKYKMFGFKDNRIVMPALYAASMWERPGAAEFKSSFSSNQDDLFRGKLSISSGDLVVVRVPVNTDFTAICWEFATDDYDIGFGLSFEWSIHPQTEISVQISESSSEDDDEMNEKLIEYSSKNDNSTESNAAGISQLASIESMKAHPETSIFTDELIRIYRRSDCYKRVCVGYHAYSGLGTYLFKFDNTYSLWRSKNLYYRIVNCNEDEMASGRRIEC